VRVDESYTSLGDVYDRYCSKYGQRREDSIVYAGDKTRRVLQDLYHSKNKQVCTSQFRNIHYTDSLVRVQVSKTEYIAMKKDIFEDVALKYSPETILSDYMLSIMDSPSELWRMRKTFAYQLAACSFMTYFFPLAGRHPGRFQFSRSSGLIAMTDILTSTVFEVFFDPFSPHAGHGQNHLFSTTDVVPFRLTPNIQKFLGPTLIEGILTSGIFSIARGLTEPEVNANCLFGPSN
jgi:transformation/transcription domain-associated protein